jgi:hypothetical protein
MKESWAGVFLFAMLLINASAETESQIFSFVFPGNMKTRSGGITTTRVQTKASASTQKK